MHRKVPNNYPNALDMRCRLDFSVQRIISLPAPRFEGIIFLKNMKAKYCYKVVICSSAWNFLKCKEVHSEINLHGILREGLFVYNDKFETDDEYIDAVIARVFSD